MFLLKSLLRNRRPLVAPPDEPLPVDGRPGADGNPRDYHRRSPVAVVRVPGVAAGRGDGEDRLLQSPQPGREVPRRMASDPPDRQPDGFISVTSRKYRYYILPFVTWNMDANCTICLGNCVCVCVSYGPHDWCGHLIRFYTFPGKEIYLHLHYIF